MDRAREQDWAGRVAAGEREACARLVCEHHAAVYGLLLHLCRDAHDAEDLAQETFAAAWGGIESFNGDSSLATWLHRIAYRKFLDWRRRAIRWGLLGKSADAWDAGGQRPPGEPMQAALADEESRRLYQAIGRLGASDAEIVILHYLQGLPPRGSAPGRRAP